MLSPRTQNPLPPASREPRVWGVSPVAAASPDFTASTRKSTPASQGPTSPTPSILYSQQGQTCRPGWGEELQQVPPVQGASPLHLLDEEPPGRGPLSCLHFPSWIMGTGHFSSQTFPQAALGLGVGCPGRGQTCRSGSPGCQELVVRKKLRCNSDEEQSVGLGWRWARRRLRPLRGQKGQFICARGDEQPGKATEGRERLRDSLG